MTYYVSSGTLNPRHSLTLRGGDRESAVAVRIDRRVTGTTRAVGQAERSLCRELVLDTDFRSQDK